METTLIIAVVGGMTLAGIAWLSSRRFRSVALPPASLEIITGPRAIVGGHLTGDRIDIYQPKTIIGRNADQVDVQLYELHQKSSVSRVHCTIHYHPEHKCYMVTDEDTRSGTRLVVPAEEQVIPLESHQSVELRHQDIIELGNIDLQGARLIFYCPDSNRARSTKRIFLSGNRNLARTEQDPVEIASEKVTLRDTKRIIEEAQQAITLKRSGSETLPKILIALPTEAEFEVNPTTEVNPHRPQPTLTARPDVFMSYSREDTEIMKRIATALERLHITVWHDEKIRTGEDWLDKVENIIRVAGCVVALMSPSAMESTWVRKELSYAENHRRRIFPVLVDGNEQSSIPLVLSASQYVDIRDVDNEAFAERMKRLSTIITDYLREAREE